MSFSLFQEHARGAMMNAETRPIKHEGVRFHFLGAKEDSELVGTVLLRDGEMVLDIPSSNGPYLLHGKSHGHRFEGTTIVPGKSNPVEARWADVGRMYVGIWIEEGYDYLFSFELPSA